MTYVFLFDWEMLNIIHELYKKFRVLQYLRNKLFQQESNRSKFECHMYSIHVVYRYQEAVANNLIAVQN